MAMLQVLVGDTIALPRRGSPQIGGHVCVEMDKWGFPDVYFRSYVEGCVCVHKYQILCTGWLHGAIQICTHAHAYRHMLTQRAPRS